MQPGGTNVDQASQHADILKSQQIASEWERWRAHEARAAIQSNKQDVGDSPISTLESPLPFKQLLDHSCGSSNVRDDRHAKDGEAVHRNPSWHLFGGQDQLAVQVQVCFEDSVLFSSGVQVSLTPNFGSLEEALDPGFFTSLYAAVMGQLAQMHCTSTRQLLQVGG